MSGSSTYIPNPDDYTQPTGSVDARTAAAEFRALKQKMAAFSPLNVTWNPNDKADWIILYSGNLLAQHSGIGSLFNGGARATVGKTGGQNWYFEHTIGTTAGVTEVGISTLTTSMGNNTYDAHLGMDLFSICYRSNGEVWTGGALVGTDATYTLGDVIGISFSAIGSVAFYKNGVFQRFVTWAPLVQSLAKYPAIMLDAPGDYLVTNFGQTAFVYTPPAGSSPLVYTLDPITGQQNVIINLDGSIDQRQAHAARTPIANTEFVSDRWGYYSTVVGVFNSQAVIASQADQAATQGALCYNRFTVAVQTAPGAADYFYFSQRIEGLNIAALHYGTAFALGSTLSFWARASVAGTYSGSIQNAARTRSYPFSFALLAATWTKVVIPVSGISSGVWSVDTTASAEVEFNLGAGANYEGAAGSWTTADDRKVTGALDLSNQIVGSTLDICRVEWRRGDYSLFSYPEVPSQSEMELECYRYYKTLPYYAAGYVAGVNAISGTVHLATPMRAAPTGATSGHANTNCANSTVTVVNAQTIHVDSVGAGAGGFIQSCTVTLDAEL